MSMADEIFINMCRDILENGTSTEGEKVRPHWEDGTPAYTIKKFGVVNRYDLSREFPIMTLRRTALKSATDEMLWIWQQKSNNINDLHSHIWDEWADPDGSIGKAYGYQLGVKHQYKEGMMDQVYRVIFDLKNNPFSRRIMTNIYVHQDLHEMNLYPCAYSMTFNVTQKKGEERLTLNAILNQRSQDVLAANNWNVVQYAVLVHMLAQVCDMNVGELVHVIADAHIYDRHVPIIKELNARVKKQYKDPKVQIIDGNKRVHMAHIDIHYGFSVNGVAAIHTDILKETELAHFYRLYPEKFNNKTNGITFRRWLLSCNSELADLLTGTIGDGYKKDANELERLLEKIDDRNVLDAIDAIKRQKKAELVAYIEEKEGVCLNPDSVFDIQIKRLHEYKRQQMNALYIIHKYLEIKAGKKPVRPISFIFGAKAAPAYVIARDIIHLLLVLSDIINNDPDVSPYMKLVMVENYNVSYAEKLIPACDISEQISLASKEASGTGNMKFMLNGAVTLGTSDGANVEIHELVGDDNIYIFGKDSDTVIGHYAKADYVSRDYYENSEVIREAVDFIVSKPVMKLGNRENLLRLYNELLNKDWFMTLLDLEEYIEVKDRMLADFEDREKWKRMMLVNIAKAGFFSSDRTIAEYNADIWHLG